MGRKRRQDIAGMVRRAVEKSTVSRRELCRDAGVDPGNFSRFMAGKRGLTLESFEKLACVLRLRLVQNGPEG